MAVPRWLVLVGITLGSACGNKSADAPPAAGSQAATAPANRAAPEQPTLAGSSDPSAPDPGSSAGSAPPPPPAPDGPRAEDDDTTPAAEFASQARDAAWAKTTEAEIRKRAAKVGAAIDAAECRTNRCMIALRGGADALGDVIAKLESPSGLAGYAQSIYLTKPEGTGEALVVRAYATFERAP